MNSSKEHKPRIKTSNEEKEQLILGTTTVAEYVGLSKEQMYAIANQGYSLIQQGCLQEAKKIYKGLVAADPYDSVFHCQLGGIYFQLKDIDNAFREYDAAIRFNLSNVDALAGRGEIYLMKGKFEDGIADLRKALENDPNAEKQSTIRARALLFSLMQNTQDDTVDSKTNIN